MSAIRVFNWFMEKYHPHLIHQDWLVDSRKVKSQDIRNSVRVKLIPLGMSEANLLLFYYDGKNEDIVYLLQDKEGKHNISIGLLSGNKLVNSVELMEMKN
ncbi:hypothetical protein J5S49_04935 [Virgibacillus halodenitrificans]|uniref:hypothetical protein n=1 Tax=Virgibacillus halodenitrificans TaxID=1482 RepID=UPI001F4443FB|nr:hypothetical protein [Virgibacillus halodenitrificans]MCG1027627.1 hypothetical protein [Virgibacillus halodenitrificans]